jgi:SAM-dependent methyltransferase
MPRNRIDFSRRANVAELTELMDEPCSREDMRACLRDLARVNRWFLGYRPTLRWLDSLNLGRFQEPVRILDVGCGYGDTLREVQSWARNRGIPVELYGLDLNPDIIAIADEATPPECGIGWIAGNVFDDPIDRPVQIVISSLFAHHLGDEDVVRFIRWMELRASIGWFVNDLSRAPIPYHLFGWFAGAMGLHRFVLHDGPVSFARAFQPHDWRRLCGAAGLSENEYQIESHQPARLCVSRSKL